MKDKQYPDWALITWDGNPSLNLQCWRKSFQGGHVSVGVGQFLSIVYSYGANSGNSLSGTRWNYDKAPLSEQEAMNIVDKNTGLYNHKFTGHSKPENWS